jgi:threonine/homoserine/homoserine lactone efflux protein
MPDVSHLEVFVVAALALLLTPGPAVLYIVTRSIEQGRIAGLVSVLGICTGTLVHVVAATLGLSALLVSSAFAFAVVKYGGTAYLIVLGVQTLLRRQPPAAAVPLARADLRRVFTQGVVVNVLNPKTALFFLAFLPQFVDLARGRPEAQILGLGLLFVLLGTVTDAERNARLRGAAAFCAPSLGGESFGVVLLEAMAASTPIVASGIDVEETARRSVQRGHRTIVRVQLCRNLPQKNRLRIEPDDRTHLDMHRADKSARKTREDLVRDAIVKAVREGASE